MKTKIPIGYKFVVGFLLVVVTAAFAPRVVQVMDIVEWMKEPISFLMAILIGLILGSVFTRSFTRDFRQLTTIANDISNGNLTRPDGVDVNGKILQDESTELALALNIMLKNLKGLVNHIKDAAANLSNAAETLNVIVAKGHKTTEDISGGTAKIFEGALEQAGHIDNASKVAMEMARTSDEVSEKMTDMSNVASQAKSAVQRGVAISVSALKKMEAILQGVDSTKEMVISLEERINNIPKILDVITHISRQTDLLALNATIEASKAGEHGRGFAIVAEEVRRFADSTNRSVEDVALIIRDIKAEVERLVNSAAESTAFTQGGREDINKVREALDEITAFTSEVADKIGSIFALAQKQKEGAESAAKLMEQVAGIARENLSTSEDVDKIVDDHRGSMEEVVISAKKLSGLSEDLDKVVARFRIKQSDAILPQQDDAEKLELAEKIV